MKQKYIFLFLLLPAILGSYLNAMEAGQLSLVERMKRFTAVSQQSISSQRKSELSNQSDQTISIKNNTNQPLDLNLTIPEHTAAVITLTKLKSAQEMLHKAILDDSTEDIRKAITAGADANIGKDNKAPILFALLLKKDKAVEALLKYGANADIIYSGHSLLQQALKLEDIKSTLLIVKKIKNTPHDIDQCMRICVHLLSKPGLQDAILELMQELINKGYDVNKIWYTGPNEKGQVHDIYWNESALKLFLKNGANPNQIINDSQGPESTCTPLLRTILYCNNKDVPPAIKILLDAGADINQKANPLLHHRSSSLLREIHSPISLALAQGKSNIVQFLLENGACLD